MKYKSKILEQLSKDDAAIIAKCIDQYTFAYKKKNIIFTDFLNGNQRVLLQDILNNELADFDWDYYGGYSEAERVQFAFFPSYENLEKDQFPIEVLELVPSNNKYISKNLTHRDYLGAILGLGIKRNRIGDIVILDNRAIVFSKDEIVDYIEANLTSIGRQKILVKKFNIDDFHMPKLNIKKINVTVSSLRIDAIISKGYNISRKDSCQLINGGKVYINWRQCSNSSALIRENDLISIRGFGRIKIGESNGLTKKDRIHLTIKKYL